MKYKIDAVHSVLKRVLKFNLDREELDKLIYELKKYGYEEENIIIEEYKEKSLYE